MSIRHLDTFSAPHSIAVVGASPHEGRLGQRIWRALRRGCRCADGSYRSFEGVLWPVNPHHDELDGVRVFHKLRQLPAAPELAVVATPPAAVADVVAELARMGTRTVLVLSQGMSAKQRQAMLDAGQRHRVRVLGPNRSGLIVPHLGLNASLAPLGALPGELALLSQSSALATAMLDWASARGIGFSQVVMLGERADVDLSDWLDHLGSDSRTRAILVYMEQPEEARKFLSASRAASRNKPVIVVKPGSTPMASRLVGPPAWTQPFPVDAVFDAAVARAGMLRVPTLPDLLLAAEILARCRDTPAQSLCVLTSSEGLAALACQAAAHANVPAQAVVLPDDASVDAITTALHTELQADPSTIVLWLYAPLMDEAATTALAAHLLPWVRTQPLRVWGCWLGEASVAQARRQWREAGIPDFPTPEAALRAWHLLHAHRRHQQQLLQTPAYHAHHVCDTQTLHQQLAACLPAPTDPEEAHPAVVEGEMALALLQTAGWTVAAGPPDTSSRRIALHVRTDAIFGPILGLSCWGMDDVTQARYALALPPLNTALAATALAPLQLEPSNATRLAQAWAALSQFLLDVPLCDAADLWLSVHEQTWSVSQAHLSLRPCLGATKPPGMTRFAIQPYPDALVQTQDWHGQTLTLRPIRPEDEAQHLAFLCRLSPEDIRMRLFHSRRTIDHSELARLTQIDYAREMALIATVIEDGIEATLGTARAMIDPDNDTAEFGVIVRSDLKHGGIGRRLMQALIAHLRQRGTRRLIGTVLRTNTAMRHLAERLGFTEQPDVEEAPDDHICLIELHLQEK